MSLAWLVLDRNRHGATWKLASYRRQSTTYSAPAEMALDYRSRERDRHRLVVCAVVRRSDIVGNLTPEAGDLAGRPLRK